MKNVHERVLEHPIAAVRPWLELAWSGTDRDVFPRDLIRTWRENPAGVDPDAMVPGVTRMGHGPFSFTLVQWDGLSWRVEVESSGRAWHGFTLDPLGERTRITHTLEGDLPLSFRAFVTPVHDWAVESLFDRLEAALDTGAVPARTARPMGRRARVFYEAMGLLRRARRGRRATTATV